MIHQKSQKVKGIPNGIKGNAIKVTFPKGKVLSEKAKRLFQKG